MHTYNKFDTKEVYRIEYFHKGIGFGPWSAERNTTCPIEIINQFMHEHLRFPEPNEDNIKYSPCREHIFGFNTPSALLDCIPRSLLCDMLSAGFHLSLYKVKTFPYNIGEKQTMWMREQGSIVKRLTCEDLLDLYEDEFISPFCR